MTHVFPLDEEHSHNFDGADCECNPYIDWDDEIVVHNRMTWGDVKEQIERMIRAVGCVDMEKVNCG